MCCIPPRHVSLSFTRREHSLHHTLIGYPNTCLRVGSPQLRTHVALVRPVLVREGGSVEFVAGVLPRRQVTVQEGAEAVVVVPLDQVRKLVDDDVLQALRRLFGKFGVDPDASGVRTAGAPFRLHLLHAPFREIDFHLGSPLIH